MKLENFENIIKDTKKRIGEIDPFLGNVINHIDVKIESDFDTCYTFGIDIKIGSQYFTRHNENDLLFAVMHELLHIVLLQPSRINGMDPYRYNVLTDIIVNDIIASYGIPSGNNPCYTGVQFNIHNIRELSIDEIEGKLAHIKTPSGISSSLVEKMRYYETDSETFVKSIISEIYSSNPLLQSKLENIYM